VTLLLFTLWANTARAGENFGSLPKVRSWLWVASAHLHHGGGGFDKLDFSVGIVGLLYVQRLCVSSAMTMQLKILKWKKSRRVVVETQLLKASGECLSHWRPTQQSCDFLQSLPMNACFDSPDVALAPRGEHRGRRREDSQHHKEALD
jgi:hypothetical protein